MSCGCNSRRTTLPPVIVNVPGLQGPAVDADELLEGVLRYDQFTDLTDDQKESLRKQIGAASEDDVPNLTNVYMKAKNAPIDETDFVGSYESAKNKPDELNAIFKRHSF